MSLGDGTVSFTAGDGANVGTVITADVMACVGVVHIIDVVLTPESGPPVEEPPVVEPPVVEPPVMEPPVVEPPVVEPPVEDPPVVEPPVVEPPVVEPPVVEPPVEEPPAVDPPAECVSLFSIIESTGELGNLETVVQVHLTNFPGILTFVVPSCTVS